MSSPPLLGATTWPVIGREEELERIAQARVTGAGGVVLYAPAGVGMSRLAREALARAQHRGAMTVWVQATRSAASVPLGAFAALIPQEVRSDDRLELLRRITRAMRELAGARRLVVGVGDGQLLDLTSAALVLHLVSTAAAFVVATVRSGEPCPDAIVSLWKDASVPRLELSGLSRVQTDELVEALLGAPTEQGLREWVWDSSRGNVLYVRELLLGALGDGALEVAAGLWRMRARAPISSSLVQLISARLAGLSDDQQRTLEVLALGEPLYVSEVIDLAGAEPLDRLERRGLIAVEGSGSEAEVRLAHPLNGETIRSTLGTFSGREIRLALVGAVQSRQPTPDLALRVARWLLDAGEPIPAATLLTAARAANLSGDPDFGAQLARKAVDARGGVEAAQVLARSHSIRNRFEEADAVLAAAEGSVETQEQALSYLERRIPVLYWGLRRTEELRQLLDRAEQWWPEDAWRDRLSPLRLAAGLLVSPEDSSQLLGESTRLIGSGDLDPAMRRRTEAVRLGGLYYAGRGREAYEFARRIRPELPLRDSSDEAVMVLCGGIAVDTGEGLCDEREWSTIVLQEAVKLGDRGAAGVVAFVLGYRSQLEGRFLDASRWLAEAQLHQEHHDPLGLLVLTSSLQAAVAEATGATAAAEGALARCRDAVRGEDPLPIQVPYLACAEAWSAMANGDAPGAQQILLDAAVELAVLPLFAARVMYEAMRAGSPARTVAPALMALNQRCDGRLVAAEAAHAEHRASGDTKALLRTVDEFEAIGALLYAFEAAEHAAEILVAEGRQDSARRAAARRRELFVEDHGRTLAPIEGLDSLPVELTRRERQLVELARLGLTNPEIAKRLMISPRTVESHLFWAMQKLGVSDRRDL